MNSLDQSEPSNDLNTIFEKIREIAVKSANDDYIYRGEPEYYQEHPYCGKVSSNLWRQYYNINMGILTIEQVQEQELKDVTRYIDVDKFDILTQLQHYGGKTNLIDFTTDYHIALFFACDGSYDKDGRVILLQQTEEKKKEYQIKEPRNPQNRVIAQKSIFVRPPKGFIEPEQYNVINIPKNLKLFMLKHLRKYHGISTETIYNDLHGFVRNQSVRWRAFAEFGKALACNEEMDYENTIIHYTKSLKINPQLTSAYYNRGLTYHLTGDYNQAITDFNEVIERESSDADAYYNRGLAYHANGDSACALKDYNKAIRLKSDDADAYNHRGHIYFANGDFARALKDYNKAIELNPYCDATTYNNRGLTHYHTSNHDWAIKDFDKAIQQNPFYAEAYNNRGVVYLKKGNYDRAVKDFNKVIQLSSNDVEAYSNRNRTYYNRGLAWLHLREWEKARADLTTARNMGTNIIVLFEHSYVSVASFEQGNDIQLPTDIAAMLTLQQ